MGNPWSGEVDIRIDGERRVMKLTLGALAELEGDLGAETLVDLVTR
ncbi:GTA-gp10 family protein, partial [Brevirhabdus pacifica]